MQQDLKPSSGHESVCVLQLFCIETISTSLPKMCHTLAVLASYQKHNVATLICMRKLYKVQLLMRLCWLQLFFIETISNPLLEMPNIPGVVAFCQEHNLTSVIDNTFASPAVFRCAQIYKIRHLWHRR